MPRFSVLLISIGTLLVAPPALFAQTGAPLFADNCSPCHNIGEAGGAAPDLRGVSSRHDRAWLIAFVLDPPSKDKAATMPPAQGLGRDEVTAILDYVDSRSAAAPVAAAPPAPPEFAPEDARRGEALFVGRQRFGGGGPACLSCHDAGHGAELGGGTLGPNLARVAARLNGPTGTAAWLMAPPTPVMRSIFASTPLARDEVHALTAFFVDPSAAPVAATRRTTPFIALAALGSGAMFVLIGVSFRRRWRPVRRALLSHESQGSRPGGLR